MATLKISGKVVFKYEIMRDGEHLVTGSSEHICVDSKMKVRTLPQPLFTALSASLKKEGALE